MNFFQLPQFDFEKQRVACAIVKPSRYVGKVLQ